MIGYPFFDPTFIILMPGLLLAIYAQFKVKNAFSKYVQVRAKSGISGAEVARRLLENARIHDVTVEQTEGHLNDHYDPRKRAIRLSPDVYNGTSLASLGIAAHETGHAMQHYQEYLPLNIRSYFVPVAQFGSTAAFPLFLFGLFFNAEWLLWTGIYLFTAVVLFQIVTLPVEFNASSRAMDRLQAQGFISGQEVTGVRKVLNAAALTYVAAALVSLLHLLRLLILAGRRD